jgi:hypothetical protein
VAAAVAVLKMVVAMAAAAEVEMAVAMAAAEAVGSDGSSDSSGTVQMLYGRAHIQLRVQRGGFSRR